MLKALIKELEKFPLLTAEEEKKLARLAEKGDKEARDRLILSNVRLVVSIARNYLQYGMPFDDLVQEGIIGLIKAVDRFDWRKGYKLSTYATWWIRQAIQRYVYRERSLLNYPSWGYEAQETAAEEVAEKHGVSMEAVRAAQATCPYTVSLDQSDDEWRDEPWAVLEDPKAESPEAAAARDWLADTIRSAMAETLTPRERAMLCLRFGLEDQRPLSYTEIGKRFGITRERVRQIVLAALRKLWLAGIDKRLTMLTWLDGHPSTTIRELHARRELIRRLILALRAVAERRKAEGH